MITFDQLEEDVSRTMESVRELRSMYYHSLIRDGSDDEEIAILRAIEIKSIQDTMEKVRGLMEEVSTEISVHLIPF